MGWHFYNHYQLMSKLSHWVKVYQQDKLLWEGIVNGVLCENQLSDMDVNETPELFEIVNTERDIRYEIEPAWQEMDIQQLSKTPSEDEISEHGSS